MISVISVKGGLSQSAHVGANVAMNRQDSTTDRNLLCNTVLQAHLGGYENMYMTFVIVERWIRFVFIAWRASWYQHGTNMSSLICLYPSTSVPLAPG